MRHVTIGQYLPTGSLVHRLDPRTKIIGLGLLVVAVAILAPASAALAGLALAVALIAVARLPLGYALGGLRPALPILLLLAVLLLAFGWGIPPDQQCATLWAGWIIHITTCSVQAVITMLARLMALMLLTSLLTLTTPITDLTHGVESLLRPFQRIGLPAHELALTLALALRFVPTLAETLEKILKAQAARGADIRMGANPVQRTRAMLPVLVPLFITTLRRSESLAEAMEARGYTGGSGRSHYVRLDFKAADAAALLVVAALIAGLFLLPFRAADQAGLAVLAEMAGNH